MRFRPLSLPVVRTLLPTQGARHRPLLCTDRAAEEQGRWGCGRVKRLILGCLLVGLLLPATSGTAAARIMQSSGASQWTQQSGGWLGWLYDVSFVDASHGWACGYDGKILATTDGGAHWSDQVSGTDQKLFAVTSVDANHAWVVGIDGIAFATTDGGAHWTAQDSHADGSWLFGVDFVDTLHGWAVGRYGAIVSTSDGGAHWTAQDSGVSEYFNLQSVRFVDDLHGWAVGDGGIIVATQDGGAHWARQDSGTVQELMSVAFADASHGWAAGAAGTILTTTDGGGHWTAQSSGLSLFISDLAFTDASHGWAVGYAGLSDDTAIIATSDGGATWVTRYSDAASSLTGIAFADGGHGWVVGAAYASGASGPVTGQILAYQSTSLTISGFTPASGPVGTVVTVTGSGFSGATAVSINGTAAVGVSVLSDAQISATVPAGATSGPISVTTPGGSASSSSAFTVSAPPLNTVLPALTGTAALGQTLACSTGTWTGTPAPTYTYQWQRGDRPIGGATAGTYVVTNADQGKTLSCLVAATNNAGSAKATSNSLAVPLPPPKLTKLSPTAGKRGATVTITGTGFGVTRGPGSVKFGIVTCSKYLSWSATRIICRVPAGAKTGKLKVTVATAGGVSSAKSFGVRR